MILTGIGITGSLSFGGSDVLKDTPRFMGFLVGDSSNDKGFSVGKADRRLANGCLSKAVTEVGSIAAWLFARFSIGASLAGTEGVGSSGVVDVLVILGSEGNTNESRESCPSDLLRGMLLLTDRNVYVLAAVGSGRGAVEAVILGSSINDSIFTADGILASCLVEKGLGLGLSAKDALSRVDLFAAPAVGVVDEVIVSDSVRLDEPSPDRLLCSSPLFLLLLPLVCNPFPDLLASLSLVRPSLLPLLPLLLLLLPPLLLPVDRPLRLVDGATVPLLLLLLPIEGRVLRIGGKVAS